MKKTTFLVSSLVFVLTVEVANADFTFGTATNLGPTVNSAYVEWGPSISADGLSLYFGSRRAGAYGPEDIYVTTRATTSDLWGDAVNLGSPVNNSKWEQLPSISVDGLTLFFSGNWSGGYGSDDLWFTTRQTKDDSWNTPVNLGATVNRSSADWTPSISADGLELYFCSDRSGGYGQYDLWVTRRETLQDPWGSPVNLGPNVNSSYREISMSISHDNRLLFFGSNRPGGSGGFDLWVTRRETANDPWGEPVNLGPIVNSSATYDQTPSISADGSTLFFYSNRQGASGDGDIYQAPVIPIVDLNGDGIVDSADMCIMIGYWGTNNSLCDIGPMPWGDRVVDVEDLKVLAEHLFEEVNDPTLLAHWKLDEEEGKIAYDSVGTNDGVIIGLPQWRFEDGAVDGALELDGTTFIAFDPVLNPADGPFSVLVWVKGGGPGQVIASSGRANWLMTDAATGELMTELSDVGQNGDSLGPEAVITDGNWHRIAFTWDGANARLYVDTLLVAEDAQDGLVNSSARLLLGASIDREPGTYWTGLIDDIRIYDRIISP